MMVLMMVSVWLTAAALLCHQYNAVAETVTEQLFFNDDAPPGGSRRTVHVGDDVVLECEAAGRPSPTVYSAQRTPRQSDISCEVSGQEYEERPSSSSGAGLHQGSTVHRLCSTVRCWTVHLRCRNNDETHHDYNVPVRRVERCVIACCSNSVHRQETRHRQRPASCPHHHVDHDDAGLRGRQRRAVLSS